MKHHRSMEVGNIYKVMLDEVRHYRVEVTAMLPERFEYLLSFNFNDLDDIHEIASYQVFFSFNPILITSATERRGEYVAIETGIL